MSTLPVEFYLSRRAETTWSSVVRPWLQRGLGHLERAYVIVPTRGQAHAFKQRCVAEGIALLGVEFLTPGLARKKWMAGFKAGSDPALAVPALGRELLLTLLKTLVERRLSERSESDPSWGFWKSVSSDTERLLEDFDDVLKAGLSAEDYPDGPLKGLFAEWLSWIESAGYTVAPLQSRIAARQPVSASAAFGRVLVLGSGPEGWGEFFSVAAFLKRTQAITVVLPEPVFATAKTLDEGWIGLWEALLGIEPTVLDTVDVTAGCEAVGALWTREEGSTERAEVLVGRTRSDEMLLVASKVESLLQSGAENVAVVFPRADSAHARLSRLLTERGIAFVDVLESSGTPPVDLAVQRSVLRFFAGGCRFEELLDLWPLLSALNLTTVPAASVRRILERLFDEFQVHSLETVLPKLRSLASEEAKEVLRVAEGLLPAWPPAFGLGFAVERFRAVCDALDLLYPIEWSAVEAFAARVSGEFPAPIAFAALQSFLPAKAAVARPAGKGLFARVTLTTRRRASGVAWSHLIFTESNAGVWPARRESSSWLSDEQRRALGEKGAFSLGIFTADDRSEIERQALLQMATDASHRIIFSAALASDEDPELPLAPNAWLERVLLAQGLDASKGGIEGAFARLARKAAGPMVERADLQGWSRIWMSRRDPAAAFDAYFLSDPSPSSRPGRLAARLIERAVRDPAELWFEAVLGVRRVPWGPFVRSYKRSLGQEAHQLLAASLQGEPAEDSFRRMPEKGAAHAVLAARLAQLRAAAPSNRYWSSYLSELEALTAELVDQVYALNAGPYVAAEVPLPKAATVPIGASGAFPVTGRMDLVLLDRPRWQDATADIVDFKTGGDSPLSAKRMASKGDSLQLGIYLAAVHSLGVARGRVWMLKPGRAPEALDSAELSLALSQLSGISDYLTSGTYGALTPDRNEHTRIFEWPLACVPIKNLILREKYVKTFGVVAGEEEETDA